MQIEQTNKLILTMHHNLKIKVNQLINHQRQNQQLYPISLKVSIMNRYNKIPHKPLKTTPTIQINQLISLSLSLIVMEKIQTKPKKLIKIAMENLSTVMKLLISMQMMLYLVHGIEIMDHFKKLNSRDRSKSGRIMVQLKTTLMKDSSTFSLSIHAPGLRGADSSMTISRFTTMSGMREPRTTRTAIAGGKHTKKRMSKSFSSPLIKTKINTMSS